MSAQSSKRRTNNAIKIKGKIDLRTRIVWFRLNASIFVLLERLENSESIDRK